jgi:cell division protein FtsL
MVQHEAEHDGLAQKREAPSLVKQRRLLNRWSIMALLIVSAGATVLYVSNVLTVKKYLRQKERLTRTNDSLRDVNATLRNETYRLQSSERITRIAEQHLGLQAPNSSPKIIRRNP